MIVIRCSENGDCCCDYEPKCVTNTTSSFSGSPTAPLEWVTEEGFSLENVTVTELPTEQSCVSSGSCTGRCGGGSEADCWCDQDCVLTGDCCCDRELVCTSQVSQTSDITLFDNSNYDSQDENVTMAGGCLPSGTCKSRCGSGSDLDCWCDEQCVLRGDCCCDIEDFCPLESAPLVNTTSSSPLEPIQEVQDSAMDNINSDSSDVTPDPTLTFDLGVSTTSDPDCQCHTNEVGPVIRGCCQFPFIYADKEHHTCIEVGGCQSWCATELDSLGRYIPDMWGFCDDTCHWDTPTPLPEVTTPVTEVIEENVTSDNNPSSESTSEESLLSSNSDLSFTLISESSTRRPFKPSDEFIESLPPDHTLVVIHEDLHDPVRVSTFKLFRSYTRPLITSSLGGYEHFIKTEHLLKSYKREN